MASTLQLDRWATEEFAHATLGDRRRTERLVKMCAQAGRRPAGVVTRVFDRAADREAAFRFIESDEFSYQDLAAASGIAAARRAAEYPFAFIAVDGSSFTITDRSGKGFGSVSVKGHGTGIQAMAALVISPERVPLGIGAQTYWTRDEQHTPRHEIDPRPVEERETQRWLDMLDAVTLAFRAAAPKTLPWFQMDRGADCAPVIEKADKLGVAFTIRAAYDRRLMDGRKLWGALDSSRRLGEYLLEVPRGPTRRARVARMEVRATAVTLDLRLGVRRRYPRVGITVWAIDARERTPPRGEPAIHWRLLTSESVSSISHAVQVIAGYSQRWAIESFHHAWKTGLCDLERSQLRALEHFAKWATLLAAVAARAERLKRLSRSEPDRPATAEFTRDEIDAVILLRKPQGARVGDEPSLGDIVRWIAELGGYTGPSSGGPPGTRVIGRALPEVIAAASAIAALRSTAGNG
jgi:hypothetical protein